MYLSNLRISSKLLVLAGALLAALVLLGGYSVHALLQAQGRQQLALQRKQQVLETVVGVRAAQVSFKLQVQEWKDLLLRGHDSGDYAHYFAAFKQARETTEADLDRVGRSMSALGAPTDGLDRVKVMHADLTAQYLAALREFAIERPETTQVVDRLVRGKDRPLNTQIEMVVASIQAMAARETEQLNAAAVADTRAAALAMLVLLLSLLGAALALAVWIGRDIAQPMQEAVATARRVASGDLSAVLTSNRRDEVGQLLSALGQMTASLESLIREVQLGGQSVAETSSQIAAGNIDLSQRTEEQAATLEETASQMEELTTTVHQNAENARQASDFAANAADMAREGGQAVSRFVGTMGEISASSRRISEITSVIDDIAFQTNILALNAAVEAARAGAHGRGFAVVATEVRQLAHRSAAAAREIKGLVGSSVEKVDQGARLVDSAGRTMQEAVDAVGKVSLLIAEIAAASKEQSVGIEQVNTAVSQMDQVLQQNASMVEEASAATDAMKDEAASLVAMMARFKLRGDRSSAAREASGRARGASVQSDKTRASAMPTHLALES